MKAVFNPNDINTHASELCTSRSGRLRVINLALLQNKSGLFLPLFHSLDFTFTIKNNFTYFLDDYSHQPRTGNVLFCKVCRFCKQLNQMGPIVKRFSLEIRLMSTLAYGIKQQTFSLKNIHLLFLNFASFSAVKSINWTDNSSVKSLIHKLHVISKTYSSISFYYS